MCEHGVNTDQMRLTIAQVDDSLAMAQQWLEQIHHLADRAEMRDPSAHVAQASVLLGDARSKLELAVGEMAGASGDDISVERV